MDTKHNILLKLPLEIFEQFGLYLSIFDLANLELLSKDVRDRVLQTKLWKKSAFRLSRKFNFDLTKRMLSYASEKYINDAKKYKIILGRLSVYFIHLKSTNLILLNFYLNSTSYYRNSKSHKKCNDTSGGRRKEN